MKAPVKPQNEQRTSVTRMVVEYVKDRIHQGLLKPGDNLPGERVLTKELGISRLSLREGLARLNALGIIDIHHGKGAFIAGDVKSKTLRDIFLPILSDPNSKEFLELIETRIVLEKAMARKAASLRTDEDIALLRFLVGKMKTTSHLPEVFARVDWQFHQEIARIADNQFLGHMAEMLNGSILEFIMKNVKRESVREKALEDHRRILECIIGQSAEEIGSVMENHITRSVHDYENLSAGAGIEERVGNKRGLTW